MMEDTKTRMMESDAYGRTVKFILPDLTDPIVPLSAGSGIINPIVIGAIIVVSA